MTMKIHSDQYKQDLLKNDHTHDEVAHHNHQQYHCCNHKHEYCHEHTHEHCQHERQNSYQNIEVTNTSKELIAYLAAVHQNHLLKIKEILSSYNSQIQTQTLAQALALALYQKHYFGNTVIEVKIPQEQFIRLVEYCSKNCQKWQLNQGFSPTLIVASLNSNLDYLELTRVYRNFFIHYLLNLESLINGNSHISRKQIETIRKNGKCLITTLDEFIVELENRYRNINATTLNIIAQGFLSPFDYFYLNLNLDDQFSLLFTSLLTDLVMVSNKNLDPEVVLSSDLNQNFDFYYPALLAH